MNEKLYVLFFYLFGGSVCVHELKGTDLEDGSFEQGSVEQNSSEQVVGRYGSKFLNSTLSKSVKRYFCASNNFNETDLLVLGTKTWLFPRQDVNLTLSYPTEENSGESEKHIITGLEVVLHIDGNQSRGYITSGGILTESITLSFVLRDISKLSYQFWLYGVDETSSLMMEPSAWNHRFC